MTKLLSSVGLVIALSTATLVAGCSLYFGKDSGNGSGQSQPAGTSPGSVGSAGSASGSAGSGATGSGTQPGFDCTTDAQCAAGCFCSDGICTEGGFCSTDKDCGQGFSCNTKRSSCEPIAVVNPNGTCAGAVTCTTAAPSCPENQVALIKNGCFTGACEAIIACEAAPVCNALQHADDCSARNADCAPVFTGHGCSGTTCGVSDADCTCTSYTFDSCESKTTAGPHVIVAD